MDEHRTPERDAEYDDSIIFDIIEAEALCENGEYEAALAFCDELLKELESWENEDQVAKLIAEVMLCSGRCLGGLERFEDELEVYNELVKRFDSLVSPDVIPLVFQARFNAAVATGQLERTETSIQMYAALVDRYQKSRNTKIRTQVAVAYYNWAIALKFSSRPNEALDKLNELIEKHESVLNAPEDSVIIVNAIVSKMGLEIGMRKTSVAIDTGLVGLQKCKEEFVGERYHLHLALATAYFIENEEASAEDHVLQLLSLLPEIPEPRTLMSVAYFLREVTRKIGVDRVVELIHRSPSVEVLSPLVEELRHSSRSLAGIKKTAQDLKVDFASFGSFLN
ncbi:MAG: hypothetical protein OXN89_23180 [Bryobacterales bacterium]|nr:hypothetical protein [Bryobacterales bacterium]